MGYLKDGPCRKFTSFFFKDKKNVLSSANNTGTKNIIKKRKTKKNK